MNEPKNSRFILGGIILVLIITLFCYSCKYDNIQPVPIPQSVSKVPWALDSSLWGENKFLTNSIVINSSLLLVANSFSIWNVVPPDINKSIYGSYIDQGQASSDLYPPSLSQDISVSLINENQLAIYPTKCASCLSNQIIFKPPYSSSTTSAKGLRGVPYGYNGGNKGGYPVIESKYILVPYECEFSSTTASFALIKIDTSINQSGSSKFGPNLSLNSFKIINLTGVPVAGNFCAAYFDKFFTLAYGYGYRIDTLGNAKILPIYPQQMFTLNKRFFCLSISNQLFVSDNQGEDWSLFATLQFPFNTLLFYNVGEDLYAVRESQLWKASMIGNQIFFTELENYGLETNLITSVNKCGRYAFVTTTSGLFYKDTANFNLAKGK